MPAGPPPITATFFAGACAGNELVAVGQGIVTNPLLHGIDADEVLDLVAVAAILAGCRADTTIIEGKGWHRSNGEMRTRPCPCRQQAFPGRARSPASHGCLHPMGSAPWHGGVLMHIGRAPVQVSSLKILSVS